MSPLVYSKASGMLIRMALLASLWWIIVQGRADAWLVGLPAVALATMASVNLSGYGLPRVSLVGLFGFVGLFLRESVSGGINVARRTLTPKLHIQPGFRRYRVHLDDPLGRVLLINCISLLTGTLAADFDGDHVGTCQVKRNSTCFKLLRALPAANNQGVTAELSGPLMYSSS